MKHVFPDVKIDQFEGPYDLLVELAKKHKVNISEISLQKLTEPFLAYLEEQQISPEIAASFIVVASTLLLVKARQILPQLKGEEEEEISTLEARLHIYEQYRKASEDIRLLWGTHPLLPARFFSEGEIKTTHNASSLPELSPELLAQALEKKIQSIPVPQPRAHITARGKSLADILKTFQERLNASSAFIFQETLQGASRQEQAVSFLAILEMSRNEEARLEQLESFGTLVVHKT